MEYKPEVDIAALVALGERLRADFASMMVRLQPQGIMPADILAIDLQQTGLIAGDAADFLQELLSWLRLERLLNTGLSNDIQFHDAVSPPDPRQFEDIVPSMAWPDVERTPSAANPTILRSETVSTASAIHQISSEADAMSVSQSFVNHRPASGDDPVLLQTTTEPVEVDFDRRDAGYSVSEATALEAIQDAATFGRVLTVTEAPISLPTASNAKVSRSLKDLARLVENTPLLVNDAPILSVTEKMQIASPTPMDKKNISSFKPVVDVGNVPNPAVISPIPSAGYAMDNDAIAEQFTAESPYTSPADKMLASQQPTFEMARNNRVTLQNKLATEDSEYPTDIVYNPKAGTQPQIRRDHLQGTSSKNKTSPSVTTSALQLHDWLQLTWQVPLLESMHNSPAIAAESQALSPGNSTAAPAQQKEQAPQITAAKARLNPTTTVKSKTISPQLQKQPSPSEFSASETINEARFIYRQDEVKSPSSLDADEIMEVLLKEIQLDYRRFYGV